MSLSPDLVLKPVPGLIVVSKIERNYRERNYCIIGFETGHLYHGCYFQKLFVGYHGSCRTIKGVVPENTVISLPNIQPSELNPFREIIG